MGYSEDQIKDLEETIRRSECDAVVIATPADLRRKIAIGQATVRVHYDFDVDLNPQIDRFLNEKL
jgi:predicted GTPase